MTPQKIEALRLALPTMSMHEKVKVLSLLEEWERREDAKKARNSLLTFVKRINPAYKIGPHHKILAHKLEAAARGDLDRLATAIAPYVGYEKASDVAKRAIAGEGTVPELLLKEGLATEDQIQAMLSPEQLTTPGVAGDKARRG